MSHCWIEWSEKSIGKTLQTVTPQKSVSKMTFLTSYSHFKVLAWNEILQDLQKLQLGNETQEICRKL